MGTNGDVTMEKTQVHLNGGGGCPFMNSNSNCEGETSKKQQQKPRKPFVLQNLLDGSQLTDTLHHKAVDVS